MAEEDRVREAPSVKGESPVLHIPRQHQSAPAETWADKEIRLAQQEIAEGKFVPTADETDPLGCLEVGLQRGQLPGRAGEFDPTQIDMSAMRTSEALLQHPRVQETLARLEREVSDAKSSEEYLEKSQMLHEMNEDAMKANRWAGQERWMGAENEEMRKGEILQPMEFMRRLERVIGGGRVFLNGFAVHKRVALLAPAPRQLIILPGQPDPRVDGMVQVATVQWPYSTEWMIMRFDDYGVPTTAKYLGWRTALLALVKQGIVAEAEARKAFPLVENRAAVVQRWYREQLWMIREQGRSN